MTTQEPMTKEDFTERTIAGIVAVYEGESCLDRLYQMGFIDNIFGEAGKIISAALVAEGSEDAGDYERVRADASAWLDEVVAGLIA